MTFEEWWKFNGWKGESWERSIARAVWFAALHEGNSKNRTAAELREYVKQIEQELTTLQLERIERLAFIDRLLATGQFGGGEEEEV